ncbi:hypothetical protein QE152_g22290 [Popillia japonica]|uniref:DUF7869 domain-containing protein n=1 Tax=Popillia japonica TaxID=7064 RepID=A0AAW1KL79_POPJA
MKVSGRKKEKEDIISTFYSLFLELRDCKHITLWLDNCSAQNKSWALFTFFVYLVCNHCDHVNLELLNIKFFEPGHTFMSADSLHHQVELQLKRKGKVYDFQDFKNCVQNANSKTKVIDMQLENFFDWKDFSPKFKLNKTNPKPYLQNMVHTIFKRGNKSMDYNTSFDGPSLTLNFLIAKYVKVNNLPSPSQKQQLRGVSKQRKFTLLSKLVAILPKNRLTFWESLATNDATGEEALYVDEDND